MMKELRKGAANKAYGQKAGQKDAPKPKPPKAGSSDPVDADEKAKKADKDEKNAAKAKIKEGLEKKYAAPFKSKPDEKD